MTTKSTLDINHFHRSLSQAGSLLTVGIAFCDRQGDQPELKDLLWVIDREIAKLLDLTGEARKAQAEQGT